MDATYCVNCGKILCIYQRGHQAYLLRTSNGFIDVCEECLDNIGYFNDDFDDTAEYKSIGPKECG